MLPSILTGQDSGCRHATCRSMLSGQRRLPCARIPDARVSKASLVLCLLGSLDASTGGQIVDCNRAHARSRMRAAGEHHAKKHTHNLTCTRACFLPRITATSLAYVSLRATPLYTSKSRNTFNVTSLVCTTHSVGMFSGPQDTRNRAAVVMFDSCCLHKSTHVIDSQTRSDAHKAHGSTRPYA